MNKRILLHAAAALLFAASSVLADVREGLVAYWPMNTTTGGTPMTTPDVVAGNTMNGPTKDGATALVAGKFGNAVTFAGSVSDYLFFTNATGADTGLPVGKSGSWTYSLWVKGAALQADQTCPFGEFSTTDAGGNPRYEMMMYGSGVNTNKLRIFMRSTGGTVLAEAPTASNVYDDTWHHIAYTYDISATSNRFRVYVDGVPNYTNSFSLNQGVSSFNCISIGARVRTTVGLPFTGQVDDVALWGRALSQAEIGDVMSNSIATPVPAFAPTVTANPVGATNLLIGDSWTLSGAVMGTRPFYYQWMKNGTNYPGANANSLPLTSMTTNDSGLYKLVITNAGGSATSTVAQITVNDYAAPNVTNGIVAYWPCNAINGAKTPDLVSGYDLTVFNMGSGNVVPGKWGNSLTFTNANSQYALRVHNTGEALPAGGMSNYTVAFWMKAPPTGVSYWAFAEGSAANNQPALAMGPHSTGKLQSFTRNASGANPISSAQSAAVAVDDTWHHIAWVQHDAAGVARVQLYIDGNLDSTYTSTFPLGVKNTCLGAYYRTAGQNYLSGQMDEVVVWNRPISPAEVTLLQTSYITNPPVNLQPLAINTFKADLPAIAQGKSTVLRWDVPANADSVSISSIGTVTGQTVSGVGSTNVSPTSTTAYVLTVTRTTGIFGTEVVKATNVVGVVTGVAANWDLLDNFDFYNPGTLGTNGWWTDVGAGASTVAVVTNGSCNRLAKTIATDGAAFLKLNNLTVNASQSCTLFFRMIPTTTDASVTRNYVGLTDRVGNFQYQYTGGNIGPALYPTINDASQTAGDWLFAARNIPYSALTYATNVLQVGAVYNVWIDITNVFIGTRVYPDNYDKFTVYIQKEGDAGRTALFTDFTSDRDLVFDDPLTGGLPTDSLNRVYLCGTRTDYSALFDDFYLSNSGYNATIPRAFGYGGLAPTLELLWSGSQWQVHFQGKLQEASSVTGTWSDVSGATSPYAVTTSGDKKFYRAVCN